MSQSNQESRPRAEEDVVATGKIVAVGVASILVFLLGSAAATWVLMGRRAELLPQGPPPIPAEAGKSKIGLIEQQLFEVASAPGELRRQQLERLQSYGWVDRSAGLVHVPIEEAMKRTAAGERP
jgi:hypothetical protein